jgi:tRNA 5-methylaminomethyl-2-thiouridine biosynthesis bifunctional protein
MRVETLIIGAGVAGAAMAHELRGQDILVLDAAAEIATGASGNPKGIIRPFLSFGNSEMREFYHAAYEYCIELLNHFKSSLIIKNGILQLPKDDEIRFSQVAALAGLGEKDFEYLSPRQTSDFLGTECLSEGIYWKRAAVIEPGAWVRALLGFAPIRLATQIVKLSPAGQSWECETSNDEVITARRVIIATGNAAGLLPPEIAQQIRPRAGQISFVPAHTLPILPQALSFGNYWIPPSNEDDDHLIGATFEVTNQAAVTAEGHQQNILAIQNLARVLPELKLTASKLTPEICAGRAAVRATTRNHMPLYGCAAPGLYYLTGLGSRGLMSAPYAAQQLRRIMDLA